MAQPNLKTIYPPDPGKPYCLIEYEIQGDTAAFLCVDGWFKTLKEGNTVLLSRQHFLMAANPMKPFRGRIYRLKLTPCVPVPFSISQWMGKST